MDYDEFQKTKTDKKYLTVKRGRKSESEVIIIDTTPASKESITIDSSGVLVKLRSVGYTGFNYTWFPMHRVLRLAYSLEEEEF